MNQQQLVAFIRAVIALMDFGFTLEAAVNTVFAARERYRG